MPATMCERSIPARGLRPSVVARRRIQTVAAAARPDAEWDEVGISGGIRGAEPSPAVMQRMPEPNRLKYSK